MSNIIISSSVNSNAIIESNQNNITADINQKDNTIYANTTGKGDKGDSAYEIAVRKGFDGTEEEWLISLKGDKFKYEDFTEQQLEELTGPKGDKGDIGLQGPQGIQGIQGPAGKDFSIYKTYKSISDMENDVDNIKEGNFVMIASNAEDEDNSKLFVKNSNGFSYISDLSGATGMKGEQGLQGIQGEQGVPGPTGPSNVISIGTVVKGEEAAATITGESPNQILNLVLPKGDKGDAAETPKSINEQIGSNLTIEASEYNAKEFKIDGKSEQETNKNVFNTILAQTTYTGKGTVVENKSTNFNLLKGYTYTFKIKFTGTDVVTTGSNRVLGLRVYTSSNTYTGSGIAINYADLSNGEKILSFTPEEDYNRFAFINYADFTSGTLEITSLEIITNTPTPDYPSEIKTIPSIKNLFDKDNYNSAPYYINGSTLTGGVKGIYISCKSNTTYTVQKSNAGTNNRFCVYTTSEIPAPGVTPLNYVGTKTGNDNSTKYTIITPSTAKYLCVFLGVSGTTPTLTEILESVQIEEGSVTHPYVPYGAWAKVKITGKNILPTNVDSWKQGTYNTTTGVISSSTIRLILKDYLKVESNQTYAISLHGSGYVFMNSFMCDENGENIQQIPLNNLTKGTFTTNNECKKIMLGVKKIDDATITPEEIEIIKPQLEKSTEPTEYEAYKEKEVLIDLSKLNLFDKDNINKLEAYLNGNTGLLTKDSNTYLTYISCNPNTTYTIEKKVSSRFAIYTSSNEPAIGESAVNVASSSSSVIHCKTNDTANYLIVMYYKSNEDTLTEQEILDSIKIYEGYTDYYELSSIGDTKDELSIIDGQVVIDKKIGKVVLDGSENYTGSLATTSTDYLYVYTPASMFDSLIKNSNNGYCDKLQKYDTILKADSTVNTPSFSLGGSANRLRMFIPLSIATTVVEFKTWLQSNNTTIYYELVEPQQIILPNTNIPLFEGINHISLVDDLETDLYVKYYTSFKGAKGEQGIQGPQGIQGIQGPKGDQGERGESGKDGIQYTAGEGIEITEDNVINCNKIDRYMTVSVLPNDESYFYTSGYYYPELSNITLTAGQIFNVHFPTSYADYYAYLSLDNRENSYYIKDSANNFLQGVDLSDKYVTLYFDGTYFVISQIENSLESNSKTNAPSVYAVNQLQKNIKEEINNRINGTVLFETEQGYEKTITLSDDTENYKCIDIFYKNIDGCYETKRLYSPNGKITLLDLHYYNPGVEAFQHWTSMIAVANNIINHDIDYYYQTKNGVVSVPESVNYIYIIKVIGYK